MVGLSIGFWNIAGARDKFENELVRNWLFKHDIVIISETKTRGTPSVPGFVAINNSKSNHGGVVALVKAGLYPKVSMIDVENEGVIAWELSCAPGLRFVGMYNEPMDSLYFRPTTLASITRHVRSGKHCIVIGDLNARLGKNVHDIVEEQDDLQYVVVDDGVNENGKTLTRICQKNGLLPVNNLCTRDNTWPSKLTYRKGSNWISELDLCLIPHTMINAVNSFVVDQDLRMPSDHAPVSVSFALECLSLRDNSELQERASLLGSYRCSQQPSKERCKKPIPYRRIDKEAFTLKLQETHPPIINVQNIQETLSQFDDVIYQASRENQTDVEIVYSSHDKQNTRWKRILQADDTKSLWRGIDWKGEFREVPSKDRPSELAFQDHMERLLNPDDVEPLQYPEGSHVSIPILDDPFSYNELHHVAKKQVKPDKSCGPNGSAPGTLKLLPVPWLMFLLTLLNTIFLNGLYPITWTISKLLMLYKKGLTMDCGNYRGISIIDALAKCYDYLLNNRLISWYIPCREQAGAQSKRGCTEHFVTLRLVIDMFVKKKQPLFIAFIDFSKAYDRVPRNYLLNLLKSHGCGVVMLTALTSLFWVTQFVLGGTIITAKVGVKQGSPTSCFLFILFVDEFIRFVKGRSDNDGSLGWLHLLMLMDDTVLFATSRERLVEKLNLLAEWCNKCGMVINEDKTQFMAFVTTDPDDKRPIVLNLHHGLVKVTHCNEYKYLGVIITSDGKVASTMSKHCIAKTKDVNKLVIFLETNKNAPFVVKKTVVDACFNASLLYGCEGWLGIKPSTTLNSMYMKAIKMLLGVRQTTRNDTCLIEAGYPSLEAAIRQRQRKFLQRMKNERKELNDDPLMFALDLTERENVSMHRYLTGVLGEAGDIVENDIRLRKERILSSQRTRATIYRQMNPELVVHPMYYSNDIIDDDFRIAFTRFRLSSHRLKIETGRWAKIPQERRLCPCGAVQTEKHVLCECPLVNDIRLSYDNGTVDFDEFLSAPKSKKQLVMVMKILDFYEDS